MTTLEKILQEIEERKEKCLSVVKIEVDPMEIAIHREQYKGLRMAEDIIKKHQSCENHDETTRQSRDNDGWIPVEERLPEKNEYFVDTSSNKEFPNGYYRRLEIAYMTDTVEYIHGYYDGYKWMDEYLDAIKNVVAWRIHEPYRPERSSDEKE